MQFILNFEEVHEILRRQHGCCAVSGLRFSMIRVSESFVKRPFAPSLERIDCSGGYTRLNVRLVCTAVNFGLGQWGDEVFRTIAEATVRHRRSALSDLAAQDLT